MTNQNPSEARKLLDTQQVVGRSYKDKAKKLISNAALQKTRKKPAIIVHRGFKKSLAGAGYVTVGPATADDYQAYPVIE